jgi:hypothetical protein
VTDAVIKAYIEHQDRNTDDVFGIEGESVPVRGHAIRRLPARGHLLAFSPLERDISSGLSRNIDFSRSCEATTVCRGRITRYAREGRHREALGSSAGRCAPEKWL